MKLLKISPTVFALFPILILFPLFHHPIANLHPEGLFIISKFFIAALHPSHDPMVLKNALHGIQVTIGIAFFSWSISLCVGIFLGILSSNIFWQTYNGSNSIGIYIRRLLAIPRAIHELVWGLLLLQILGLTPLVAIIGISIPYSSLIARVTANQLDMLDNQTLIAIKHSGAGYLSALTTSVAPKIIPILTTYGGYRLECALRGAALLGMFGLGGIGNEIQLSLQSLEFNELWTSLWVLFGVMILLENALTSIRKSYFEPNSTQVNNYYKAFTISSLVVIFSLSLPSLGINFKDLHIHYFNWPSFSEIINAFYQLPIFELITATILMTFLSACIAIGTPPILLMLFPEKLGASLLSILWTFFRVIPPPLTALLILLCTTPSISVAAIALGIKNIGVMGRLLNENLNQQNNSLFNAIKSSGASTRIAWVYGKLSPQSKTYITFASYRTDVILRETAVVGIVGGIGLGWQLQESLSSFAWNQVIAITITFTTITLIGEFISDKINEYWLKTTTDTSLKISLQA